MCLDTDDGSFSQFVQTKYETLCTHNWKKYIILNTVCKNIPYYPSIIQFSQSDIPSVLQLFLIFFGTGFEVSTVVRIHNVVWVRMLYSLVYG